MQQHIFKNVTCGVFASSNLNLYFRILIDHYFIFLDFRRCRCFCGCFGDFVKLLISHGLSLIIFIYYKYLGNDLFVRIKKKK